MTKLTTAALFFLAKKDGKILAIVPAVGGCKDYVYKPSPIEETTEECNEVGISSTLHNYERWTKIRAPGQDPANLDLVSGRLYLDKNTKTSISFSRK